LPAFPNREAPAPVRADFARAADFSDLPLLKDAEKDAQLATKASRDLFA
jgi:hypothetical protein